MSGWRSGRLTVPVLAAVLLLGVGAVGASAARADDVEVKNLSLGSPANRTTVVVTLRQGLPSPHGVGWGFVPFVLRNVSDRPVAVDLLAGEHAADDVVRQSTLRINLAAGATERAWLPAPPGARGAARASIPGHAESLGAWWPGRTPVVLFVGVGGHAQAETDFAAAWNARVFTTGHTHRGRRDSVGVAHVEAADLPPTPAWLTATTLIVLDGAAKGLDDAGRQQVLRRWVFGGGLLHVQGRPSMPKGPLQELLAGAADRETVVHGLGRLTHSDGAVLTPLEAERVVAGWIPRQASDKQLWGTMVLPMAFVRGESIPGLGGVPIRAFFLLLVAFVVLVGPVAYFWARRRRRLTTLVWVVPVVGLSFAAVTLGVGLASEGFGIQGSVRSFTHLDQRDRSFVCTATRTLFAGRAPRSLRVSPDTAVWAHSQPPEYHFHFGRGPPALTPLRAFHFDVASHTLDGRVLPSRTLTPLASVTQGTTRDRLRFRRRPEGGFDPLLADGFAPLPGAGEIVLRDPAGDWFVSSFDGVLALVLPREGEAVWEHIVTGGFELDPLPPDEGGYDRYSGWSDDGSSNGESPKAEYRRFHEARLPPLAPGSYLARTTRAPGFDDLGLSPTWRRAVHVVHGILAEGDLDG